MIILCDRTEIKGNGSFWSLSVADSVFKRSRGVVNVDKGNGPNKFFALHAHCNLRGHTPATCLINMDIVMMSANKNNKNNLTKATRNKTKLNKIIVVRSDYRKTHRHF